MKVLFIDLCFPFFNMFKCMKKGLFHYEDCNNGDKQHGRSGDFAAISLYVQKKKKKLLSQ